MVCPEALTPSDAFLELKYRLIKSRQISEKIKIAIKSSRSFARRGHQFPFVYYPDTEVAYWPGCSLSGTSPELAKRSLQLLKKRYHKVDLILDCCFDPAFQNGDIDEVKEAVERIKSRLKTHGTKKLIIGCLNCKKIFDLFMPVVETEHILNALTISDKPFKNGSCLKEIYLHHPCPSFRFKELQEDAEERLALNFTVKESSKIPMCCGSGGLSHALSEDLSKEFTEKVVEASKDSTIITYCMGCKNRFFKKGKRAYHILEFLGDIEPLEKPVSSSKKWFNRFFLSLSMRLKGKKFLVAVILIVAIIASTYLQQKGYLSIDSILEFIKAHKIIAPLIFILLYAIGPSIFLPSLPMTIGAGFIWGPLWGVVFSITGATIGASVAFFLARYIMADTIKARFGYETWQWLKERVERYGWKVVAFARLFPLLPFPVLNYLFGITPIPFIHYVWSSFVFMLPACIAYVVFGSSMEELITRGNIKALIGSIFLVSLIMLLPFALKKLFKKVNTDA